MATIVTRGGKGSALTHAEGDANFTNLNTDKVEADDVRTFSNKSIDLATNTVTGTTAEFNAALSDNDFATQAGAETLTNKTLTSPTLNTPTITTPDINGGTADSLTSLTVTASAADGAKDSLRLQVNGITALKALTPVSGERVYLTYHTTEGDGGHGVFKGVTGGSPGTYTDDNGVTILPTGGDGSTAWVREYEGEISVKWFGAKGDGVTDDRTAIQSCIDLAPAHVYFPPGTYLVGSSLNITTATRGLTLFGDAQGTLNGTSGTANINLGFDGVLFDINGGGVSNQHLGITFENLYLNGNAASRTAGTAIYVYGLARNILIKDCHIVNFYDYGVRVLSAGGVHIRDTDIFNCGYNLYGDSWADSTIIGGQSGSGAGGGAAWVNDNIYLLGAGGNLHFVNHRPNFSAGIGVRIGGNVTRCSFVGGLCDNNIGHGFSLEDNCTAIKIVGMDIFDNGTTSVNKSGIDITTAQGATGFQGRAGIAIVGNSIFDRDKGTINEVMATGISINTGGSVTDFTISGNDLTLLTNPITTLSNLRGKPGVEIEGNVGVKTRLSGVTTATIATDSTGVKTIANVDVSSLTEALHASSVVKLSFTQPTNTDFAGTLMATSASSGTTFNIVANITTASATGGATVKVAWSVDNQPQG